MLRLATTFLLALLAPFTLAGHSCKYAWKLEDRCCLESDLSDCRCPVRDYTEGFGSSFIQRRWDHTCETLEEKVNECYDDIATTATNANFTTLVAALDAAGLVDAVSGDATSDTALTVFAPTDDAFAELGDIVTCLLSDDGIADLTNILTFHVVGSSVLSGELEDGQTVATLEGASITVAIDEAADTITVSGDNSATISDPFDVLCTNGVVHTIDKVLIPTNFQPTSSCFV